MSDTVSYRLDGQVGMVTGAANGIGRELAEGLAEAGADIVIADLPGQAAAAEETAALVRAKGRRALIVAMDVTVVASIEAGVAAAVKEFGLLDFLVNNAGVNIRKPVLDYTEAEWDKIVSVNLKGVFFCTQTVARQMVAQGGGRIVNIASQLAAVAMQDRSIYAITKAGVAHMAKAFGLELGPRGVSVNAVGPTFVSTPLTTSMFTSEEFIGQNLPRIPSGRFGTTKDILGAVRFLLSPAADLINGHLLLVDGGYTIH
ncbi:MAG: glucose 1-dehydrogenase [Chloroflexi bacterium]|nr:glucose 1-dehydrogenase [Chloroflexota bacterium]